MLVCVYYSVLLIKMNNMICCVKNDVVNACSIDVVNECSIDVLTWIA